MTCRRLCAGVSQVAFLCGVATLAWIGLGTVHLLSGRDLGAGFQPAYLAFAIAAVCGLGDPELRSRILGAAPHPALWLAALLAILLSGLGLRNAEIDVPAATAGLRFAKQLAQWLVMVVICLVTAAHLRDEGMWPRAVAALAIGVGVQFAYGIVQVLAFGGGAGWYEALDRVFTSNPAILAGSDELYLGHGFAGIPRVRGTACEPLYLANLMLLSLPWLLAWGWRDRRWILPAGAALVLLIASWSRGAWLAATAAALFAVVVAGRLGLRPSRRLLLPVLLCGLTVIAILLLLFGVDAVLLPVQRLWQSFSVADWSNLTRMYSAQAAWRAFVESPLIGVGWGQFAFNYYSLVDIQGLQAQFDWPVVNNLPLLILCETGLVGFGTFCAGALLLLRRLRRGFAGAQRDPGDAWPRIRLLAAATAVLGVWLQLLTFSQYNLPHIWVALGMLLAAVERAGDATIEAGAS